MRRIILPAIFIGVFLGLFFGRVTAVLAVYCGCDYISKCIERSSTDGSCLLWDNRCPCGGGSPTCSAGQHPCNSITDCCDNGIDGCNDDSNCGGDTPSCCNGTCQESCSGGGGHTCRLGLLGTTDDSGNLLVGNTYTFINTHFEGTHTQDLSAIVTGQPCYLHNDPTETPNPFWVNRLFNYSRSTPLWPHPTWIPDKAGAYTLYCINSESGSWECTGHRCLKNDGTLETTDSCGANSHLKVTVVNPVPSPTCLPASCTTTGTASTATVSWDSDPGASYYSLRIDDLADAWQPGACPDTSPNTTPTGGGDDQCLNTTSTSYTFAAIPGHTYGWWIHARDSSGNWIPVSGVSCSNFSCPAAPTPAPTPPPSAQAWWQVIDGDVTTNGDLNSSIPDTAGLYFDDLPTWGKPTGQGYPGIPAYGGSTNLTQSNVSVTGWLANSTYNSTKVYGSAYFLSKVPANVTKIPSNTEDGSYFLSGGTEEDIGTNQYFWYEYDGSGMNPTFTISSPVNLLGRKVILLVTGISDVELQGSINLTDGQGFFLLAVGGNIVVDPSVTNLEGIFVADEQFLTGTTGTQTDTKLWIRGSVAAYGGLSLQRDLGGAANSTTPSELFEYAPDLDLLFPTSLGVHSTHWQEVAP